MDIDIDSKIDPSMIFSGSGAFEYKPTKVFEAGIDSSTHHSISAMEKYQNQSFEEIRMEDYIASSYYFGSKLAKLAGVFCVRPGKKLTPYSYGRLYQEAIKPLNIKSEDSKFALSVAHQPVDPFFKMPNPKSNVNLSFHGTPNVTVLNYSGSDVNLCIHTASTDAAQKSKFCDRKQEEDPKKHESRHGKMSSEKSHKNKKEYDITKISESAYEFL